VSTLTAVLPVWIPDSSARQPILDGDCFDGLARPTTGLTTRMRGARPARQANISEAPSRTRPSSKTRI